MTVLTIEQVLSDAHTANGFYQWSVEGGTVTLTREQLLPALQDAYDPSMEEWPTMVDIQSATFTLLRRTTNSWTDHHGDAPAEFASEQQALDVAADLDAAWGTVSQWRVVPTADLANYELVA